MKKLVASAILVAVCAGCAAPKSRFEFGSYDQSLYRYTKSGEARAEYVEALEKAIAKGKSTNRLAPGLMAELGYIKLELGDQTAAIALFEAEMAAFPESSIFMQRIIAGLRAPAPIQHSTPTSSSEKDRSEAQEAGSVSEAVGGGAA